MGGYHANGAPGLDFLDKHSPATGNAQAPDRESLRHACVGKASIMLFSRYKVAYERKRKIMRNVAAVAELKKSGKGLVNVCRPDRPGEFFYSLGSWAIILRAFGPADIGRRWQPLSQSSPRSCLAGRGNPHRRWVLWAALSALSRGWFFDLAATGLGGTVALRPDLGMRARGGKFTRRVAPRSGRPGSAGRGHRSAMSLPSDAVFQRPAPFRRLTPVV